MSIVSGEKEALCALREELIVHEGPRREDGAPTWVVEDPARGRYFQLGWVQGEMLMRWHLGTAEAVAQAVSEQTTLRVRKDDVTAFGKFLFASGLTFGEGTTERCAAEAGRREAGKSVWKFLFHHYLFFKIPLVKPDDFLSRTLPVVSAVFFRAGFWRLTLFAFFLGLYFTSRQWEVFTQSLMQFFSFEGAAVAALTLAATKILHELGHAYTAKRLGCRVPTMGLAFMVMMPLLYTDTTDAWRLPRQRDRISVGVAGVAAEMALAVWATLVWNLLPDGILRSAMLMLATTTWVMTLAVNLSPFMRFDGYYVLSDLFNVSNLHQRSFALARRELRRFFLGLDEPAPEAFSQAKQRLLIIYAYGTWLYRLTVFFGIALIVYHTFFKALGIFLFCVEVGVFIVMPVVKELAAWGKAVKDGKASGRAWGLAAAVVILAAALLIPWRQEVSMPAVLRPMEVAELYAPRAAVVKAVLVKAGDRVKKGDVLLQLASDSLSHDIASLEADLKRLLWQQTFQRVRREAAGGVSVAEHETEALVRRLARLKEDERKLAVIAPCDGFVADFSEELSAGVVLGEGEWLGTVASGPDKGYQATGLAEEQVLHRLAPGAAATFISEDPMRPSVPLVLSAFDRTAVRHVTDFQELSSVSGGPLAVRSAPAELARRLGGGRGQVLVPEAALYRVQFQTTRELAVTGDMQRLRGHVVVECDGESLLADYAKRAVAVFLRETGF